MDRGYFIFALLSLAMVWNFVFYLRKRKPGAYEIRYQAVIFQCLVSLVMISFGAALLRRSYDQIGFGTDSSAYLNLLFVISGFVGLFHALILHLDAKNRLR